MLPLVVAIVSLRYLNLPAPPPLTLSTDTAGSSSEDPLDAFMSAVRSEAAMDAVERRKLHVHVADMRKEVQRLQKLVELTRPAQLPSLQPR